MESLNTIETPVPGGAYSAGEDSTETSVPQLCVLCCQTFSSKGDLQEHMNIHKREKPFECSYCDLRYKQYNDLFKHLSSFHKGRPLCLKVGYVVHVDDDKRVKGNLPKEGLLKKESDTRNESNIGAPNNDYTESMKINDQWSVVSSAKNNEVSRCAQTNDSSEKTCLLDKAVKRYECTFCTERFSEQQRLIVHVKQHIGGMCKCDICGMRYKRLSDLQRHIKRLHEGCPIPKAIKTPFDSIDAENGRENCADVSAIGFNDSKDDPQFDFEIVKVTEAGSILLMDTEDDIDFTASMRFVEVRPVQIPPKRKTTKQIYECTFCNKIFRNNNNLHEHMLTHTGEKPFVCVVCDLRFRQRSAVSRHMKTAHKGYQCQVVKEAEQTLESTYAPNMSENNSVGILMRNELKRLDNQSYPVIETANFMDSGMGSVTAHKNYHAGKVVKEGFDELKRLDNQSYPVIETANFMDSGMRSVTAHKNYHAGKVVKESFDSTYSPGIGENTSMGIFMKGGSVPKMQDFQSYPVTETGGFVGTDAGSVGITAHKEYQLGKVIRKGIDSTYASSIGENDSVGIGMKDETVKQRPENQSYPVTEMGDFISTCAESVVGMENDDECGDSIDWEYDHGTKVTDIPQCTICNKTFPYKSLLEEHMLAHTGKNPYACFLCEMRFRNRSAVYVHMKIAHKGQFDGKQIERNPYSNNNRGVVWNIPEENYVKNTMAEHLNGSKGYSVVEAGVDQLNSSQAYSVVEAGVDQNYSQDYSAVEAGVEQNGSQGHSVVAVGVEQSTSSQNYSSTEAGGPISSSDRDVVGRHDTANGCEGNSVGVSNSVSAKDNAELKNKLKTIGEKVKLNQCMICGKLCNYSLTQHMRIHTGEKPYQCDFCGKRFRHHKSHRRHVIVVHKGSFSKQKKDKVEKRHPCTLCKKRYSSPSDLTDHMRSHTGEKPFRCDICEGKFMSMKFLRQHMKTIHEGCPVHTVVEQSLLNQNIGEKALSVENQTSSEIQQATESVGSNYGKSLTAAEDVAKCKCKGLFKKRIDRLQLQMKTTPKECPIHKVVKKSLANQNIDKSVGEKSVENQTNSEIQREVEIFVTDAKSLTVTEEVKCTCKRKTKSEERIYQCTYCPKAFKIPSRLREHIARHTRVLQHKCHFCDMRFRQSNSRSKHMRTVHKGMSKHHQIRKAPNSDSAESVEENCTKEALLNDETVGKSRDTAGSVDMPGVEKEDNESTSNTMRASKNLSVNKNETSKWEQSKNDEVFDKNGKEYRFQCKECGKRFAYSTHFKDHMVVHTGERPHKCDYCEMRFGLWGSCRKHVIAVHKGRPIPTRVRQRCTLYEIVSTGDQTNSEDAPLAGSKDFLDSSVGSNDGVGKDADEGTGRSENESVDLSPDNDKGLKCQQGMDDTKGERTDIFKCNICDKLFRNSHNLKEHVRSHTGEKPFRCVLCDKRFNYHTSICRHLRTVHKGYEAGKETGKAEGSNDVKRIRRKRIKKVPMKDKGITNPSARKKKREFECTICSHTFSYSSHLKDHIMTHSDEKPHTCDTCGKTFRFRRNLKAHISAVHKEKNVSEKSDKKVLIKENIVEKGSYSLNRPITETGDASGSCDRSDDGTESVEDCPKEDSSRKLSGWSIPGVENDSEHLMKKVKKQQSGQKRAEHSVDSRKGRRIGENRIENIMMDNESIGMRMNYDICLKAEPEDAENASNFEMENEDNERADDVVGKGFADLSADEGEASNSAQHENGGTGNMVKIFQYTYKIFQCKVCGKIFTYNSHLREHMRRHTGEKPFSCEFCDMKFTHRVTWTRHVSRKHPGSASVKVSRESSCSERKSVGENCTTQPQANRLDEVQDLVGSDAHSEMEPEKDDTSEPDKISANDSEASKLRQSKRIRGKTFQCTFCSKTFSQLRQFQEHTRSHTGERPYKCDFCDMSFNYYRNHKRHVLNMHTKNDKAKVGSVDHLEKDHVQINNDETSSYACDFCENKYRYLRGLTRHMSTAHKEMNNKPGGQAFKNDGNQINSNKSGDFEDSGGQPNVDSEDDDDMCMDSTNNGLTVLSSKENKEAENEQELDKRNHNKDDNECKGRTNRSARKKKRVFECTICSHTFSYSSHLKDHIMTHSDEKPHACNICGKRFRFRRNWKAHVTAVHKELDAPGKKHPSAKSGDFEDSGGQSNVDSEGDDSKRMLSTDSGLTALSSKESNTFKSRQEPDKCKRRHKSVFPCKFCSRSFSRKQLFQEHTKSHTGERPFKCDFCDMSFSMKRYCKRHVHNVHTKTKTFKPRSTKLYVRDGGQDKDEVSLINLSEENQLGPNTCPSTEAVERDSKKCQSSESVEMESKKCLEGTGSPVQDGNKHKGISYLLTPDANTGKKKRVYECTACSKTFSYSSHLKDHIMTHTDERPHACDICGKTFRFRRNRKRHIIDVHKKLDAPGEVQKPCFRPYIRDEDPATKDVISNEVSITSEETPYAKISGGHSNVETEINDTVTHCSGNKDTDKESVGLSVYKGEEPNAVNSAVAEVSNAHSNVDTERNDTHCSVYNIDKEGMGSSVEKGEGLNSVNSEAPLTADGRSNVKTEKNDTHCSGHIDKECVGSSADGNDEPQRGSGSKNKSSEMVKCTLCHKTFHCKQYLKEHVRSHTGERPFKCVLCGMRFSYQTSASRHVRTVHKGCDENDIGKIKPKIRNRKAKKHPVAYKYKCYLCDETFQSYALRLKHLKQVHEGYSYTAPKKMPSKSLCSVCGYTCSAYKLKIHMRKHTGETPYECEFCHMKFRYQSSLSTHRKLRKLHGSCQINRPKVKLDEVKCIVCGKLFPEKRQLESHMRIHTGEKPFKCDFCNMRFRYGTSIRKHLNFRSAHNACPRPFVDDSMKKYQCTLCGKKLARERSLKEHMKIHTGEKPFRCTYCEKRFRFAGTLYRHVRKRHKGYPVHKAVRTSPDCSGYPVQNADRALPDYNNSRNPVQKTPPDSSGYPGQKVVSATPDYSGYPVQKLVGTPSDYSGYPVQKARAPPDSGGYPVQKAVSAAPDYSGYSVQKAVSAPPDFNGYPVHKAVIAPPGYSGYPVQKTVGTLPDYSGYPVQNADKALTDYSGYSVQKADRAPLDSSRNMTGGSSYNTENHENYPVVDIANYDGTDERSDLWTENDDSEHMDISNQLPNPNLSANEEKKATDSKEENQNIGKKYSSLTLVNCTFCSKTCKSNNIKEHMLRHTGEKPHKCNFCDERFRQRSGLLRHLKNVHNIVKKPMVLFGDKNAGRTEAEEALGNKKNRKGGRASRKYECMYCNLIFTYSYRFREHVRRHTKETPFECEFCHVKFIHRSSIRRHLIIRESRGRCPRYSTRHSGEKPVRKSKKKPIEIFRCTVCSTVFSKTEHLERHMKTHMGEKHFQCEFCELGFSFFGDLFRHVKSSHEGCPVPNPIRKVDFCKDESLVEGNVNEVSLSDNTNPIGLQKDSSEVVGKPVFSNGSNSVEGNGNEVSLSTNIVDMQNNSKDYSVIAVIDIEDFEGANQRSIAVTESDDK